MDYQLDDDLFGIREEFFYHYEDDTMVICGHTPVQVLQKMFPEAKNIPFRMPNRNILMTDTGSYLPEGAISCVDILTGEFWQSDDDEEQEGIIFVCAGNTCRSPMAKYVMKDLFAKVGLSKKFVVDSAGCAAYGDSVMSTEASVELKKHNIPCDNHKVKLFTANDYKNFEYIIALDEYVLNEAKKFAAAILKIKFACSKTLKAMN